MKIENHYHQSNKRLALTRINQLVRNIFSNCHQLPTWRNTRNGTNLVPKWALTSNLSSAFSTDVKPPTTNTPKQNDSHLELSCPSPELVIPDLFFCVSDKMAQGTPIADPPVRDTSCRITRVVYLVLCTSSCLPRVAYLVCTSCCVSCVSKFGRRKLSISDDTYEPIRCEINFAATDDLGPGLCVRTRITDFEGNIHSPLIIAFVPIHPPVRDTSCCVPRVVYLVLYTSSCVPRLVYLVTTTTTRRDHPRRALQSTCIKRKWPCPPRPVLTNLIQLERSLLRKNRFESDYCCNNCGFIESTIIGFRLTYVYPPDLLSAPPKYEILI